jgi:SulP family sulfate permease
MNFKQYLPVFQWASSYQKGWLKPDIFAGLTVGVMLVPQGIAYAMIAGLPPIYGLYTALIPLLVYAVLGTSRQLSAGPVAMDSLIVASGISTLATVGSEHFVILAITLAFFVGLFQILFGLFRLGFLVNFLSRPVISGFTSGSAIIIAFNQLGNLLGIPVGQGNQIHFLLLDFFKEIQKINWITALIGISSVALLFISKRYLPKFPSSFVIVVLGIILVYAFHLNDVGVAVIGEIPKGLPHFQWPSINQENFQALSSLALTLALIGFMEAISVAKTMESKHNDHRVSANQELVALGFGNLIGSFFQAYPSSAGLSRTAVNDQAGGKTQLSAVISALVVGLTLLFLTPVFFFLPKAVLAAIIIFAAFGLLDFKVPRKLLTFNRLDLIILNVTLLITIIFGIKEGILTGIIISLAMLIFKSTKPHIAVLGKVPNTNFYRNIERFGDLVIDKEILIIRLDAQLYFVNTSYFKDKVYEFAREKGDDLKLVILVFDSINNLDSSAIYVLDEIHNYFSEKGINIVLTGIKGPVRDALAKSGLIKKIKYDHCFMNIQEAVDSFSQDKLQKPGAYSYQQFIKQINR